MGNRIVYSQVIGPDRYFEINEEQLELLVSEILLLPGIEEHLRDYHDQYLKYKDPSYGTDLAWPDGSFKSISDISLPSEKQLAELAIKFTGNILGLKPGMFAAMKRVMGSEYKVKEYNIG